MKALVLNSGGVDSTTCVAIAVNKYGKDNVITASLYYGQKHDKELQCAKKIAEYYGVRHIEEDISNVMKYAGEVCSLVKGSKDEILDMSYADQIKQNGEGRVGTYVPFRNGLLLSIATAFADSLFPGEEVEVFYGAHADDATGEAYADCSPEFADAMDTAINIGTYGKIHINRPLIHMNKAEVVKTGLSLNVPYEMTWSCYHGGQKACGKCGTCIDRKNAFRINGVEDPIEYEEDQKMYYVSKKMEIAGAHRLDLPYESGCSNLHGHNWIITVHCRGKQLNPYGMLVDFKKVKECIHSQLDHRYINDVVEFNPTAENMAKWICTQVTMICPIGIECYKVEVQESEGNIAAYEVD